MCFSEVLRELRQNSVQVNAVQLRWAITSGKISRPPLDASLRFDFSKQHVEDLLNHFRQK